MVSSSASVNEKGEMTITLANPSLSESLTVEACVVGDYVSCQAMVLTGKMGDYNNFETPDCVKLENFDKATINDGKLTVEMPALSIVKVVLSKSEEQS